MIQRRMHVKREFRKYGYGEENTVLISEPGVASTACAGKWYYLRNLVGPSAVLGGTLIRQKEGTLVVEVLDSPSEKFCFVSPGNLVPAVNGFLPRSISSSDMFYSDLVRDLEDAGMWQKVK